MGHRVPVALAAILAAAGLAGVRPALAANLAACGDFGLSTEEDFVTLGPSPPDGNPLISDGDLFARNCAICARNAELLAVFQLGAQLDLGLDAADVVALGEEVVVAFSTELDSPTPGLFEAGDLLATNGIVIPNVVLLQRFGVDRDLGLDGLAFLGPPEQILGFLAQAALLSRSDWLDDPARLLELLGDFQVELLVSTEGTAPSPSTPGFLDGDVLAVAAGSVFAGNGDLLPVDVPAGLPLRGVDFGVDALAADEREQVARLLFSSELDWAGPGAFGDSDLLAQPLGPIASGAHLVGCFEPLSVDLGLDAISVPEPGPWLGAVPGAALLALLARRRRRARAPRSPRPATRAAAGDR